MFYVSYIEGLGYGGFEENLREKNATQAKAAKGNRDDHRCFEFRQGRKVNFPGNGNKDILKE